MAFGFLTTLSAKKVREARSGGRAEWVLLTDLAFHSELIGLVVVPTGFKTDFASVPRAPLAFWLAGDTAHASSTVHDYLCRIDYAQARISWPTAAAVFREAMRYEGVPAWRRALMHWGVLQANPESKWEEA